VAHRGEEGALGLRRRLGLLARALKLGHVVVDAEEARVGAFRHKRDEHQLDVDGCSVLAHSPRDPLCAPGCHRLARGLAALLPRAVAEDEVVDVAAERFLRRVAEKLAGCRVPLGHNLIPVHDDHRRRADLDE
jgi:hypothetical protein